MPSRMYFTMRDLLVLVAIIGLGLCIGLPGVRTSREATRRAQCVNNLKSIGLGIQNYHDVRREIVPSYLTDDQSVSALPNDYATWPILFLPFIEGGVADWCAAGQKMTAQTMPFHAQTRKTSFFLYFCPSRRSPPQLTSNGDCTVGDYACVSRADLDPACIPSDPRTWDAAMLPSKVLNASATVAVIDGINLGPGDYRSLTNFASVRDGLSNTAFVGEKAVHKDRLGGDPNNFANTVQAGQQDGTFYYGCGGNPADLIEPGEMAYWSRRLAPAISTDRLVPLNPYREDPRNRFGSWHGGVTLFVMGDSSVRTVNNAASMFILQRLGSRNDGQGYVDPP